MLRGAFCASFENFVLVVAVLGLSLGGPAFARASDSGHLAGAGERQTLSEEIRHHVEIPAEAVGGRLSSASPWFLSPKAYVLLAGLALLLLLVYAQLRSRDPEDDTARTKDGAGAPLPQTPSSAREPTKAVMNEPPPDDPHPRDDRAEPMEPRQREVRRLVHELNNVLAGVMGNADLARLDLEQRDLPAAEDKLNLIIKSAQRASDLCQEALTDSRESASPVIGSSKAPSATEQPREGQDAATELIVSGTVLIVDDEPQVRNMVRRAVERAGFTTAVAEDGADGVECLQQLREEVCCVLLDLTMPRMDGATAFREMRRISPQLPVIVMSGYSPNQVAERFHNDRPSKFLAKPFSVQVLTRAVHQAISA